MKVVLLIIGLVGLLYSHGIGEDHIDLLNSPAPDWLTVTGPLVAKPIEDGIDTVQQNNFRRVLTNEVQNTRYSVTIPHLGVNFETDYPIFYSFNPDVGSGVSLSPDEKTLLTNSGRKVRFYDVSDKDDIVELDIEVPSVTYDEGEKGIILSWSWGSNDILVGDATIESPDGHDVTETRLYLYDIKDKVLTRLDLSNLKHDTNPEGRYVYDLVSVNKNLNEIIVSVNGIKHLLSADLKSPLINLLKSGDSSNLEAKSRSLGEATSESFGKYPSESSSSSEKVGRGYFKWVIIGILLLVIVWVFGKDYIKKA